jgi:hypothetical protein
VQWHRTERDPVRSGVLSACMHPGTFPSRPAGSSSTSCTWSDAVVAWETQSLQSVATAFTGVHPAAAVPATPGAGSRPASAVGRRLLQPWGVVGPDDLAVAHFEAGELVGGTGVVVETHDGAVQVRYV